MVEARNSNENVFFAIIENVFFFALCACSGGPVCKRRCLCRSFIHCALLWVFAIILSNRPNDLHDYKCVLLLVFFLSKCVLSLALCSAAAAAAAMKLWVFLTKWAHTPNIHHPSVYIIVYLCRIQLREFLKKM